MGFSSNSAIAEINRNEAERAINILGLMRDEIVIEYVNTDDDDSAEVFAQWRDALDSAIELVQKFSEKHQPDVQRWK